MGKNKLVISLVLGTIALSVLSLSASLAWYASSDQLHVNSIDLDLRADEDVGLFISTKKDENSFKGELANKDLMGVEQFIPTSSMFQDNWISAKNPTPLFSGYLHE